jgi:hypothetical protein
LFAPKLLSYSDGPWLLGKGSNREKVRNTINECPRLREFYQVGKMLISVTHSSRIPSYLLPEIFSNDNNAVPDDTDEHHSTPHTFNDDPSGDEETTSGILPPLKRHCNQNNNDRANDSLHLILEEQRREDGTCAPTLDNEKNILTPCSAFGDTLKTSSRKRNRTIDTNL